MRSIETSETYVDYLEGKVMENLSQRMIDKSIEAFMMGLEIYNKGKIRSVDLESYYNLMVLLHVNIRLIF